MKRFMYKGKERTFSELLPFSVVTEKKLYGRLFTGSSLWSVEAALKTPFGEKSKTDETSVNDSCKIEKRAKISKPQTAFHNSRYKEEMFYCVECRTFKNAELIGRIYENNCKQCTACFGKASKRIGDSWCGY